MLHHWQSVPDHCNTVLTHSERGDHAEVDDEEISLISDQLRRMTEDLMSREDQRADRPSPAPDDDLPITPLITKLREVNARSRSSGGMW